MHPSRQAYLAENPASDPVDDDNLDDNEDEEDEDTADMMAAMGFKAFGHKAAPPKKDKTSIADNRPGKRRRIDPPYVPDLTGANASPAQLVDRTLSYATTDSEIPLELDPESEPIAPLAQPPPHLGPPDAVKTRGSLQSTPSSRPYHEMHLLRTKGLRDPVTGIVAYFRKSFIEDPWVRLLSKPHVSTTDSTIIAQEGTTSTQTDDADANATISELPIVETQISIADNTVGLVIGRGGETIKDIQARSRCQVKIAGKEKAVGGYRTVTLFGTEEAVGVAREMIEEIVSHG